MENLNKENFWNALMEKYPKGVQAFCDWIDEYKHKNDWDRLFNAGIEEFSRGMMRGEIVEMGRTRAPKYHDLPLAMQIGIYIEFMIDRGGCGWECNLMEIDWREEIEGMIKIIHESEV